MNRKFSIKDVQILIGFESSGVMANAFSDIGFSVLSCDLEPNKSFSNHYQGNVFDLALDVFDFAMFFPPCTYLAKAQMWRCLYDTERSDLREKSLDLVDNLFNLPIPRIVIENPVGYLNTNWRPPSQIIYPWWFGDPYSKEICLWLKKVPPVIASLYNPTRKSIQNHVNGRMSQALKSEIKSSWKWYPGMAHELARQFAYSILKDLEIQLA